MHGLRYGSVAAVVLLALAGCTATGSGRTVSRWEAGGAASPSVSAGAPSGSAPAPIDSRLRAQVLTTLPARLSRPVVLADGAAILVAGGLTAGQASTAVVLRIDPASGRVSNAGRLAQPVHDAAGAAVGGRDLVFGGGEAVSFDTVQSIVPGGVGQVTGHLPQPRSDLSATGAGGTAYLLGGYTGSRMLSSVLETGDGRTFRSLALLPVPVRYAALALSGGELLVVGGITGSGSATDAVQRVDVKTGAAALLGHLGHPLSHAAGFALAGSVYVAGGLAGAARTTAILRIDAGTGAASPAGNLPSAVSDSGVTALGNVAYLVGGEAPNPVDTVVEIRAGG